MLSQSFHVGGVIGMPKGFGKYQEAIGGGKECGKFDEHTADAGRREGRSKSRDVDELE
jgi:hypothetical protein